MNPCIRQVFLWRAKRFGTTAMNLLASITIKIPFNPTRNRISPGDKIDTPTIMELYWSGFTEKLHAQLFFLTKRL